jgi:hypothetical protein
MASDEARGSRERDALSRHPGNLRFPATASRVVENAEGFQVVDDGFRLFRFSELFLPSP